MATKIIYPKAIGTYDTFAAGGGYTKMAALSTSDADTQYTTKPGGAGAPIDTYTNTGIPPAVEVSQVLTYLTSKGVGGTPHIYYYLYISITEAGAGTERTNANGSYTNWTEALSRPGGGDWDTNSVNSVEIGYRYVDGAVEMRVTACWATVTYVPAGGALITFGFNFSWLPPLLALASHGLCQSEIVQFFSSRDTKPTTKDEFEFINGLFLRRPKFCFVGM